MVQCFVPYFWVNLQQFARIYLRSWSLNVMLGKFFICYTNTIFPGRIFESKAEEVLEACYAEDNQRAKMLLYRKLQEYGHSAVIRLAARGGCIHFMSHPCCQDFLSEVWMGKLSSKTTNFQVCLTLKLR